MSIETNRERDVIRRARKERVQKERLIVVVAAVAIVFVVRHL